MPKRTNDAISRSDRVLLASLAIILATASAAVGASLAYRPSTDKVAAVAAKALEVMHFKAPPAGQTWKRDNLAEELDHKGEPFCEAGCYRCLLSYYNQPDHTLVDRKDKAAGGLLLDMLCRLTEARTNQGTQGRGPEEHDAQLARTAGSTLEQAWLDHVCEHGLRKPDRGQHTIPGASACADFFYDDLNLVVFVDGPHHETDTQQAQDAAIDRRLDELGYLVVRFPKNTGGWSAIFKNNADLFGPGKA